MPPLKPAQDTASVVLLGSFSPAAFQPLWLAQKGLIREAEAANAQIEVVHPELTVFRSGWLVLNAQLDRLVLLTEDQAQHVALRDLALGILQLFEHVPMTKLGINRSMHFRLRDEAQWHAIGHQLAPKAPWSGVLDSPGMRSLTMESPVGGGVEGVVRVKVEPSVQQAPHGVFLDVNNDLPPPNGADASEHFSGVLRDHWAPLMQRAVEMANLLLVAHVTPEGK